MAWLTVIVSPPVVHWRDCSVLHQPHHYHWVAKQNQQVAEESCDTERKTHRNLTVCGCWNVANNSVALHMKCIVYIRMWLSMREAIRWNQTKPESIQYRHVVLFFFSRCSYGYLALLKKSNTLDIINLSKFHFFAVAKCNLFPLLSSFSWFHGQHLQRNTKLQVRVIFPVTVWGPLISLKLINVWIITEPNVP